MKKNLLVAVTVAFLGLLFSNLVFAQSDRVISAAGDTYVISAKAGGVNFVEGNVTIVRKDGKSGALLKSDSVEVGDKVTTGADGKAEILLNPGSYVRLGADAQFEFQSTDLDNLKLKLSAGSAIFEVYADNEFKVTLDLPANDIELTKSGVYRVDILADGRERIAVWKGKVIVGDDKAEVTAGNEVFLKGTTASTIAKFDRKNKDALDLWSDLRAKEASNINKRLKKAALTGSLMDAYNRGGWNMYGSFGVWVFDPFSGRWCFMPFGRGWRSPYGYSYRFDFYDCPLPPIVWTNPNPTPIPTTPNPGGGQMTPAQAEIREARRQSARTPTFQRFENNTREERGGGRNNGGGWNNNSDNRSDSSDTRSNSSSSSSSSSSGSSNNSPSQSSPSPSVPSSSSVPTRTESKDVKID
jgi:hypothetical protein